MIFCLTPGIFLRRQLKKLIFSLHFLLTINISSISSAIYLTDYAFSALSFLRMLMKSQANLLASFLFLNKSNFLYSWAISRSRSEGSALLLINPVKIYLIRSGSFMKVSSVSKGRIGERSLAFSTKSKSSENTRFLNAATLFWLGCEFCLFLNSAIALSSFQRMVISSTQSSSSILLIVYKML